MSINKGITYALVLFMIIGALDKIFNNKFGLGKKFDEGFMAMGPLAIAMIGMISFAPVFAKVLAPIIAPLYSLVGADPSMFATTILANDMGGYQLAMQLAHTKEAGLFSGLIVGAMLGPTIVFSIPVALGIIEEKDRSYFARGTLAGIATIPFGALAGGLAAGFDIVMLFKNLVPVTTIALLIVLGLWKAPEGTMKFFNALAKTVLVVITLSTVAIVTETLTGLVIVPGMAPVWDGVKIVGSIGIVLLGAFPMVYAVIGLFKTKNVMVAGMISALANNIIMFGMMKEMDERGKIISSAFAVSAAFTFGDHLGFTAGVNSDFIFPVVLAKLIGGATAVVLASILAPSPKQTQSP